MSTYSSNLRIELIGTGEQAGTWGTTTNTNLGTLIENAISGYEAVSVTSANQALTAINGADDQARNMIVDVTTTTGADFAIYAPPTPKVYVVNNSSAFIATIYNSTVLGNTTAAGTGVAVPAGKSTTVWSDGTDMAVAYNTRTLDSVAGTIDGVTIGATTPAAAAVTDFETTGAITEAVYDMGAGVDLDPANGTIQTKVLSANVTFTESLASGQSLVLQFLGGATYTVTWPTVTWVGAAGNTAPVLSGSDVVIFWKISSTLYASYAGSFV